MIIFVYLILEETQRKEKVFIYLTLLAQIRPNIKEVTELNGKVQFSSKVHFFGEL